MSIESFDQFAPSAPLKSALSALGYKIPTPVRSASITAVLSGRDILGCSHTDTGKTGAFALPMLQLLSKAGRRPARHQTRSIVLTPTRELAMQIAASFKDYGRGLRLKLSVIYGGVKQSPLVRSCVNGLDVLVATPGRLLDLIVQGHLSLASLEVFVLDEADRMLDMGFLPDVRRVLAMIPARTQTLFFSATMPPAIEKLTTSILHNPMRMQIALSATHVRPI